MAPVGRYQDQLRLDVGGRVLRGQINQGNSVALVLAWGSSRARQAFVPSPAPYSSCPAHTPGREKLEYVRFCSSSDKYSTYCKGTGKPNSSPTLFFTLLLMLSHGWVFKPRFCLTACHLKGVLLRKPGVCRRKTIISIVECCCKHIFTSHPDLLLTSEMILPQSLKSRNSGSKYLHSSSYIKLQAGNNQNHSLKLINANNCF